MLDVKDLQVTIRGEFYADNSDSLQHIRIKYVTSID